MKKEQSSTGRAFVAGAVGGVIAVVVMAILAAVLMRRLGPRMMRCCCGSGEMRGCCGSCDCGKSAEAEPEVVSEGGGAGVDEGGDEGGGFDR
jgi:hypothetical protein